MKAGYVYILTDSQNRVLYTGVTSDLLKRIWEHKNHVVEGFSKKYNVIKLVFYEQGEDIYGAICREKQIKGKLRKKKIEMINKMNPEWKYLYYDIIDK
jgi:putative endonuclease